MGKSKHIYLGGGIEQGLRWSLLVNILAKQPNWHGFFSMAEKKRKTKKLQLIGGSERGHEWSLAVEISAKQPNWSGFFNIAEKVRVPKHKRIYLAGGTEEAFRWKLDISIRTNQRNWMGNFSLRDEVQKYRDQRRSLDHQWANRTFPQPWLQRFEIHHRWNQNETCFFLTKEQHRERDREIRYGSLDLHDLHQTQTLR